MISELDRACHLYLQRDLDGLQAACDAMLAKEPRNFGAHYLMALLKLERGDVVAASRSMEEAVFAKPEIARYGFLVQQLRAGDIEGLKAHWFHRLERHILFERYKRFLLSYPKCGRTWLHFMLGHYALAGRSGNPLALPQITLRDPTLPNVAVLHDDFPHLKPHDDLETDKTIYRERKVVLLVRDPRDVLVSNYFQFTRRGDRELARDSAFTGSLSEFIRHPIGGLRSIVAFYNIWARNRQVPKRFLLLTYEALHRDTPRALKIVLDFLDFPERGPAALADAIEAGGFENMQRLEREAALQSPALGSKIANDPEALKARRGKVGGYRDYLSDEDIGYINAYLGQHLDRFYAQYVNIVR